MSTALSLVSNNTSLNIWDDQNKVEQIKKIFAPTLSSLEFEFFMGLGKATGLNPFTREIWAVKYGNSAAQVFVGRDGYRIAAQRHPSYDYHQCDAVYDNDQFRIAQGEVEHSYGLKNRGKLIGAYCIVKRKGAEKPIYVFVELSEYTTGKSLWNEQTGKPATMIKKVAEAQALRMAFQDLLGGTYCDEEYSRNEKAKVGQAVVNSPNVSQTERLKQVINAPIDVDEETGEIVEPTLHVHNTGRDDILISDEQLDLIAGLMKEKGFASERLQKALEYYKVDELEKMTDAQARLFILRLEKL